MFDTGRQSDMMYLPHHGAGFATNPVGLSPPIPPFKPSVVAVHDWQANP